MGHHKEVAHGESNGHVIEDHVRPWRQYVWAHYLENGLSDRFGYKGAPIGNGTWGIKCPKTSRDPNMSRSWPRYIWLQIFRKPLDKEAWCQRTTNRKWHMANQTVAWSMTSHDPERSGSWLHWSIMFVAHYLENSRFGYNGALIGNGTWGIKWSHDRWRHVT